MIQARVDLNASREMANPLAYPPRSSQHGPHVQGSANGQVPDHLSMKKPIQYSIYVDGELHKKRTIGFETAAKSSAIALASWFSRPDPARASHLTDQGWQEIVIAERLVIAGSLQAVRLHVERSDFCDWEGGWILGGAKLKWLGDVNAQ